MRSRTQKITPAPAGCPDRLPRTPFLGPIPHTAVWLAAQRRGGRAGRSGGAPEVGSDHDGGAAARAVLQPRGRRAQRQAVRRLRRGPGVRPGAAHARPDRRSAVGRDRLPKRFVPRFSLCAFTKARLVEAVGCQVRRILVQHGACAGSRPSDAVRPLAVRRALRCCACRTSGQCAPAW